jgi:hypothetical protein
MLRFALITTTIEFIYDFRGTVLRKSGASIRILHSLFYKYYCGLVNKPTIINPR